MAATDLSKNCRGSSEETRKPCIPWPDKAPNQSKQEQRQRGIAEPSMPDHCIAPDLDRYEGAKDCHHERPVK